MRVLIITHPRSGGTTLTKWLSKELGYNCINEPDYEEANDKIKLAAESDDNIVAKIFPYRLTQNNINVESFIKTYDKVIFHLRTNPLDVAISLVHSKITRNFNLEYTLDNDFIKTNEDKIIYEIEVVKNFYYQDVKKYFNKDLFYTTYEDVYNTGNDIDKIKNYIGIDKLEYIDLINTKNKYSKSILNLTDLKKEPKIIKHYSTEKFIKSII